MHRRVVHGQLGWVVPGDDACRPPFPLNRCSTPHRRRVPVYALPARPAPQGVIELIRGRRRLSREHSFQARQRIPPTLTNGPTWPTRRAGISSPPKARKCDVAIAYSCDDKAAGGTYSLSVGSNTLSGPVKTTGSWSDFHNPAPSGSRKFVLPRGDANHPSEVNQTTP